MPLQPSLIMPGQLNSAAKDAELEWLLCLGSALEACKQAGHSAEAMSRRRVEALPRPPRRGSAHKSNVA
jgi:hypothetical protein